LFITDNYLRVRDSISSTIIPCSLFRDSARLTIVENVAIATDPPSFRTDGLLC